jgi:NADH-quinone oxidoreductase subunit M
MEKFPILLLTILMPLVSAIFLALFVKQSRNPAKVLYAKYVAVLSSVLTLVSSIFLVINFDLETGYQYKETYSFLPSMGLEIDLGLDGFSIFFVLLTAILTVICISISMFSITKTIKEFLICFLLLESFSIGVFCATNLLLFYIFFEAILIPMYLIIGIWGGTDRVYATLKFFLYTLFGSVLFLIDIVYLFNEFGTLSIPALAKLAPTLPFEVQCYLWIAAFIAFAVKVPMLPFHTWLPDAHVQAPTAGSVILAGILLKIGAYGFIRVSLPMFPEASKYYSELVLILSVIAIIYASLVAIAQTDMKKMIAYSSVAHMGYVTAGIFSFNHEGLTGAVMQMISHGIVSSGLFMVVGVLYDRLHTKEISSFGGVAAKMPNLAFIFMVLTLSSVGLPGTSGFVGEFYSIVGLYSTNWHYAFFATLAVILGAIYMLRLYRNVMLGVIHNEEIHKFSDLSIRELFCLAPLAFATIVFGIFPTLITKYFTNEVALLLSNMGITQ